jgi:hypothetical protein
MATTIQTFFEQAKSRQFARDFLFRVKQINLAGGISFNGETDLVYAKTATLPGRAIENKTVNYVGQQFNVPGKSTYSGSEGYSIEFYHEEAITLRKSFETASRTVFNNETSTGDYRMPGEESTITLSVLNSQLEEIETIVLVGASIRDIGEVSYTIAEGSGEILSFTVTFAFHYYNRF